MGSRGRRETVGAVGTGGGDGQAGGAEKFQRKGMGRMPQRDDGPPAATMGGTISARGTTRARGRAAGAAGLADRRRQARRWPARGRRRGRPWTMTGLLARPLA
ncbi:MAG: hypothetical protein U0840_28265 [Gemmataceae bacterium]